MDHWETDRRELLGSLLRATRAADHLARRRYAAESLRLYEEVAARLSQLSESTGEIVRRSSSPPPARDGRAPGALERANALRRGIAAGLRAEWSDLAEDGDRAVAFARRYAALFTGLLALVATWVARPWWTLRELSSGATWKASSHMTGVPSNGVLRAPSAFDDVPNYFVHTKEEKRPHVDVDLGAERTIETVIVTNRIDCCVERGRDLEIWIGHDGEHFRRVSRRSHDDQNREWVATIPRVAARFVRLELPRKDLLHLARVRVFGR